MRQKITGNINIQSRHRTALKDGSLQENSRKGCGKIMKIPNDNNKVYNPSYTPKVTARSLTFVIAFMLAMVCFMTMPTTQLFAADVPFEPTTCASSDDMILTQPVDVDEPSCTITLAVEDLVVVKNPSSPIVIDEPNMPQLMMQLFMPLASR
jgi:hypothetical protein